MKASIDRSGCIGCGSCVGICPEVFRLADDGLSEVYTEPTQETIDKAKEAAANCPAEVITVEA